MSPAGDSPGGQHRSDPAPVGPSDGRTSNGRTSTRRTSNGRTGTGRTGTGRTGRLTREGRVVGSGRLEEDAYRKGRPLLGTRR